jgi:DNA-binding transcriptional regulator LsrR (DeoR family)
MSIPPRQSDCLRAIKAHWAEFSESPTRLEIGRALGITPVSAHLLVRKLAKAGAVDVVPRIHRGIGLALAANK